MSYRVHVTYADSIHVHILNDSEIAQQIPGYENAQGSDRHMVLADHGNQEAFVLFGNPEQWVKLGMEIINKAIKLGLKPEPVESSEGDLDALMAHGPSGEHPDWPRGEWRDCVRYGDTSLGYWAWVQHNVETAEPVGSIDDDEDELEDWCSTNDCERASCHRCFPRTDCLDHEKCRDFADRGEAYTDEQAEELSREGDPESGWGDGKHCPNGGVHEPDVLTVAPADGCPGQDIVDVNCKKCGRSGSFFLSENGVNWE